MQKRVRMMVYGGVLCFAMGVSVLVDHKVVPILMLLGATVAIDGIIVLASHCIDSVSTETTRGK